MKAISLDFLSHIRISGEDAKTFLQGQLTCDLNDLSDSQASLGAYCNLQGRIISLFHIYKYNGTYYLVMPVELIDQTLETLTRYRMRAKVEFQTHQAEWTRVGLIGEGALKAIEDLGFDTSMQAWQVQVVNELMCVRHPGETLVFELFGYQSKIDDLLAQYDEQGKMEDWYLPGLKQGVAFLNTETSGKFLPQELSLDKLGGVSFDKGCYLGQEIIARLHYKGKLKKQLVACYYQEETEFGVNLEQGQLVCGVYDINEKNYYGLVLKKA